MEHKVIIVVLLALVMSTVEGQQQASNCQRTFLQGAMACVQNAQINFVNLQFMNTNGTAGQMPQQGLNQFKLMACNARPQVDRCGMTQFMRVFNTTLCMSGLDDQQLMQTSKEIFGYYDIACAKPCRHSLENQIRQCFQYSNTDLKTWADNAWAKGNVLGNTAREVNQICNLQNKQQLLNCLRQTTQGCLDASVVLQRKGMDVQSMEKVIEGYCQYPGVYMGNLWCFQRPPPEIQMCYNTANMAMMQHMTQFQSYHNDHRLLLETCRTRFNQLNCEINAWARRQGQQTCHQVVRGMRNEVQCKTLPSQCMTLMPQEYQRFCNTMNFHADKRPYYSSAGRAVATWSLAVIAATTYFMFSA